jgi:hypothetical protein
MRSAGSESPTVAEAVTMVKSWFHGRSGRSLVIFDSADTIDNADDASYVDLNYFLPDAPCVDVIIMTRSSRAQEMTALEVVKVADMKSAEAAELFRTSVKLGQTGLEVEKEIMLIVQELGYLALAITLAGSYVAATPRLRSDIHSYLPEYRERRKQLLGMKARKLIHRYGESVLICGAGWPPWLGKFQIYQSCDLYRDTQRATHHFSRSSDELCLTNMQGNKSIFVSTAPPCSLHADCHEIGY